MFESKHSLCFLNYQLDTIWKLIIHFQANGFFGARGVSGAIPDGYTYIAREFMAQVDRREQKSRIKMHEFSKPGWTFHGKGLWYYLPHNTFPSLTFIGSPNFGQ